jgi:hypothetical protein
MKQSLGLSEQDIKEFETLEEIPKTIIEGVCGDLLKNKSVSVRSGFQKFNDEVSVGRRPLTYPQKEGTLYGSLF